MIYLHGSDERQRAIADAISRRATSEFKPQWPDQSGTKRRPGLVKITQESRRWAVTWAFWLRAWQCAPGRIRTRDPLLRRSLKIAAQLLVRRSQAVETWP
jgi:hypothetical protein